MPRRNSARARSSSPPSAPPTERQLAWHLFGGRSAAFVVVVLAAMALALPGVAVWDYLRNDRFRTDGVTADGVILDKQAQPPPADPRQSAAPDRWVRYRFTDKAGVIHTSRHGVTASEFDRLAVGGTVPVEYLSAEPQTNRLKLGGFAAWGRWAIAGGMGVAFAALSASAWVFGRRAARRRAWLVFHGRPVAGEVTSAELKRSGKAQRHVVTYRFADADGAVRTGKVDHVGREVFERTRAGQKVTVLVDPDDAKRHEPDLYGVRGSVPSPP